MCHVKGRYKTKSSSRSGRCCNQSGVAALLATFGYSNVKVVKQPVVGIVTTGSELLEVHESLQRGKLEIVTLI